MPTQFYDKWEWFTSNGNNLMARATFSFKLKGRSKSKPYAKNRLILELCKAILNTDDFTNKEKEQFEKIVRTARKDQVPKGLTFMPVHQRFDRHFREKDEVITLPDGEKVFLSTEWGAGVNNVLDPNSSFMSFLSLLRNFKDENGDYIVQIECDKGGNEKVAQNGEKEMSNNSDQNQNKTLYPRQIIYFGAPGTSKSYTLNKDAEKIANQERVTFYPGYSYQQFVGTYKPFMDGDKISYKFVPGPLLRLLEKALKAEKAEKAKPQDKNKEDTSAAQTSTENQENGKKEKDTEKFLLIVEELNRAEAAAVFGDLFQLLDRNSDGESEYPISVSEDLKQYLRRNNGNDVGVWADVPENEQKKLYFPSNFYIWATMNSADQGVFPLDTAFKRRWDFKYFGIDDAANKLENNDVQKFWNELRKTINKELHAKLKLNEDKLLGPFFMKVEEDIKEQTFWQRFCSKVLLYLYEDAARLKRSQIFKDKTYSEIYNAFKKINSEDTLEKTWNEVFFSEKPASDYPWAKAEEMEPPASPAGANEPAGETVTE